MNAATELYHRAATADLTPAEFAGAAAAVFLDNRGGHTCEALAVSKYHRMAVLAVTDAPGRYAIARHSSNGKLKEWTPAECAEILAVAGAESPARVDCFRVRKTAVGRSVCRESVIEF